MHAIVVTVEFDPARGDEASAILSNVVIPQAKASAGFGSGYWMRTPDHAHGISVEFFDSRESAEAALAGRPAPPPGTPITVTSAHVMEIAASA
jgi:hypothetical protein